MMKKYKLFLAFLILTVFVFCKKETILSTKPVENCTEKDALEYAVFNQTLSNLGENILFDYYNLPEEVQKEIVKYKFEKVDKKEFFKRIKQEKIDTAKTPLSKINFLLFQDSLAPNNSLKSIKLQVQKINKPQGTIFINEKDRILHFGVKPNILNLSRVLFNKHKTKAEYNFEIIRGPLAGVGYKVKCEFKNGAWLIVTKEMIWIS